jgi:hypothetical protein
LAHLRFFLLLLCFCHLCFFVLLLSFSLLTQSSETILAYRRPSPHSKSVADERFNLRERKKSSFFPETRASVCQQVYNNNNNNATATTLSSST